MVEPEGRQVWWQDWKQNVHPYTPADAVRYADGGSDGDDDNEDNNDDDDDPQNPVLKTLVLFHNNFW